MMMATATTRPQEKRRGTAGRRPARAPPCSSAPCPHARHTRVNRHIARAQPHAKRTTGRRAGGGGTNVQLGNSARELTTRTSSPRRPKARDKPPDKTTTQSGAPLRGQRAAVGRRVVEQRHVDEPQFRAQAVEAAAVAERGAVSHRHVLQDDGRVVRKDAAAVLGRITVGKREALSQEAQEVSGRGWHAETARRRDAKGAGRGRAAEGGRAGGTEGGASAYRSTFNR